VHEFTRHQLPVGWHVLEGTSVSYGKATPYLPLIEMLHQYFQITDSDPREEIQQRVTTHILDLNQMLKDTIPAILLLLSALPDETNSPAPAEHDWALQQQTLIETLKRFGAMDPQQRRRQTLDAVKRVLVCESQRQPLLVVFEDLHWIDNETQAFLDGFVESLPMARILLLVDYRPEYRHAWSDRSYYRQIRVDPLNPASAEELIRYLLGHDKDLAPLGQMLTQRTVGNPFFAEESVRSLVETGVLMGEKGAYRRGVSIDEIRLPSTVQSVVADRIDRLSTDEKRVLQTAAVIGVIVSWSLLQAAVDMSDQDLQRHLSRLQTAEFLYESNLFPELEYSFRHAITCEAAYNGLLHERKVSLHARIVTAIEKSADGNTLEYIETLAHHAYYGEFWEKAVSYAWQAGGKAAQSSANQEAREFFKTSLRALARLPQTRANLQKSIDLRLELRNPLYFLSEFDELHRCLREAESIAEDISDDRRLGRVINFLNSYYGLMGEHRRSIEFGARALRINRDDEELNTVTHYYMGAAYHHLGEYAQSSEHLRRALFTTEQDRFKYERFGTAHILSVICRIWLAQTSAQLGCFPEAKELAEEASRIAQQAYHASSLAFSNITLGFVDLLQGNVEPAITALEKSLTICDANNIQVFIPHIGSNLAYAYALVGRVGDAIPLIERIDDQSKLSRRKAAWALRLAWLGHASLLGQRIDKAREQAERAVALSVDSGERGYEAWAHKLLGDIAQQGASRLEDAFNHYNQSMALTTQLSMRPLQAHIHFGLGRLHRRENQIEQARAELSLALKFYGSMEMAFWEAAADREIKTLVD